MKIKHCFFILGCAVSTAQADQEKPLPDGWRPDLSYVQQVVEDHYGDTAQQGMNLSSARVFEIRDAQLALVFLELYSRLSSSGRRSLKAEQSKWLKHRDAEIDRITPPPEERGTIVPWEQNSLATEITEKRIKQLQRRLDTLP